MTATYNYIWPQGADLTLGFRYLEGPEGEETAVDLTGYTARMDIVHPDTKEVLFVFNTEEQEDPDEIFVNAGGIGKVAIRVPRSLTLPPSNGQTPSPVYQALQNGTTVFNYDIFLRNTSNLQTKIYGGTIRVEASHTLWR